MPDKPSDARLVEILTSHERHAREAAEVWVSEREIHAMAAELIDLRAADNARQRREIAEELIQLRQRVEDHEKDKQRVTKLEAELKYYRDNNRHTTDEYA